MEKDFDLTSVDRFIINLLGWFNVHQVKNEINWYSFTRDRKFIFESIKTERALVKFKTKPAFPNRSPLC